MGERVQYSVIFRNNLHFGEAVMKSEFMCMTQVTDVSKTAKRTF